MLTEGTVRRDVPAAADQIRGIFGVWNLRAGYIGWERQGLIRLISVREKACEGGLWLNGVIRTFERIDGLALAQLEIVEANHVVGCRLDATDQFGPDYKLRFAL